MRSLPSVEPLVVWVSLSSGEPVTVIEEVTAPGCSDPLTVVVRFPRTRIWEWTSVLKPSRANVTVYVPNGRSTNSKDASFFVPFSSSRFVPFFLTGPLAHWTPAPEASMTAPLIAPKDCCAYSGAVRSRKAKTNRRKLRANEEVISSPLVTTRIFAPGITIFPAPIYASDNTIRQHLFRNVRCFTAPTQGRVPNVG